MLSKNEINTALFNLYSDFQRVINDSIVIAHYTKPITPKNIVSFSEIIRVFWSEYDSFDNKNIVSIENFALLDTISPENIDAYNRNDFSLKIVSQEISDVITNKINSSLEFNFDIEIFPDKLKPIIDLYIYTQNI
jgi:hypothetical protein